MLNYIIHFIEQWLGALPAVVFSFLGVLVCVVVVSALWDRRLKYFSASLAIMVGLAMTFNAPLLGFLSTLSPAQRVACGGIAGGLAVIAATVFAFKKDRLQRRYALFWSACGIGLIVASLHPSVNAEIAQVAGNPALVVMCGAAGAVLFLFAFHVSIAISQLERRFQRMQALLAIDEKSGERPAAVEAGKKGTVPWKTVRAFRTWLSVQSDPRSIRGSRVGVPLVIAIATISVVTVGLATPQAMIGDEVTHYYMMVKQSSDLSEPNYYAEIPLADGGNEIRRYPHSFGWHYLGALVFRISGGSFAAVQAYQAAFLFQFLLVAYLLARSRGGVETRAALVYVLVLASLPLCLIFSVAFYQDVPMTAQALTALYFLQKRRWLFAALFIGLALWMKVTAVLFFPVFFFLLAVWQIRSTDWLRGLFACCVALVVVLSATWMIGRAVNIYGHTAFYPQEKMQMVLNLAKEHVVHLFPAKEKKLHREQKRKERAEKQFAGGSPHETDPVIIANHPGDLRIKQNYLIYGGILLWIVLLAGAITWVPPFRRRVPKEELPSGSWLLLVGGSYLLMTAYMIRSAPDARFFLPGLPFLLLPIVERVVYLPKPKVIISLIATLALLQGGYVLKEAYDLRVVPTGIRAGIAYLEQHPPEPKRIFMYPEGNYRLFPCNHEWYLGYRLREFWRANNDQRIEMLHRYGIGAIVIKKRLIVAVDEEITNLGVYPTYFVEDIRSDSRFVKVFENEDLLMYKTPQTLDPKTVE